MKKALKLIFAYLMTFVLGCTAGILIIVQYFNTIALVAGRDLHLFNIDILVRGFFFVVPVIILYAGMLLVLYCIRHPENKIISVLVYLILCVVTWGVVYPAFLELSAKYGKSTVPVVTETQLSPGYFRRSGNKIYYLIGSTSERENDAVAINIDGSGLQSILSEEGNVSENLKKQSAPFSDILIRETMTDKPSWLHTAYYHLENLAEKAWSEGIIHWLCFASFGLALCAVYALIFCSSWRMINSLYVWFGEVFVTVMNNLYFTPMALPVRLAAKSWGGFFRLLDEPALVTANVAVSLIFIIFGITAIIIRSRRSGR